MRALVFDPINIGLSHASFNWTTVKSLVNCKNIESLDVILSKSQLEQELFLQIYKESKVKNITKINCSKKALSSSLEKESRLSYLKEMFLSYKELLKSIKKRQPDLIYILASDNFYSLLFLFLIKKNYNINTFVFLHNNVENSKHSKIKLAFWRALLSKNFYGIVLSEFVYRKGKELFNKKVNLKVVPHPSYSHIVGNFEKQFEKLQNDFLVLGRHSGYYALDNFENNLINEIKKSQPQKKIKLIIKRGSIKSPNLEKLEINEYEFPLSDGEYWQLLRNSKFLIIPPQAAERITASGVHIDAITAGTPVLAPKLGTFIENVPLQGEKFLFNDSNACKAFENALKISDEEYKILMKRIKDVSESLSLHTYTFRLNQLITNLE